MYSGTKAAKSFHQGQGVFICGKGFGFAGLWERWAPKDSDVEAVESCSIIVTAANSVMAPIHERMPVILAPGDYDRWLAPETPGDTLKAMLQPCDPAMIQAWPVSTRVNSPRNDGADLLDVPSDQG